MRGKQKPRFSVLQKILFCFFGLIFLVGLGIFISTLLTARGAAKANRELQAQIFESIPSHFSTESEAPEAVEEVLNTESFDAKRRISMDFAPLLQINSDAVAWLYAEGANIDYPVFHTYDNDYYLTHLYNHEKSEYGSLFVDFRNHKDFSDKNTVIYGHHMRNGTMFGSLESYRSQDFYDAIPTMMLYTPEGDYRIELICGTEESGDYEFVELQFETDSDFLAYVDRFRERSTFRSDVEVQPDDRIVSLCTCSYAHNNARYMLIGKLVPLYG